MEVFPPVLWHKLKHSLMSHSYYYTHPFLIWALKLFVLLSLLLPVESVFAQESFSGLVCGTVVNVASEQPLMGATVQPLGGTGTIKDLDGKF